MGNSKKVKTVWKYTLEVEDSQVLELPYGALYLSGACQRRRAAAFGELDEHIVLWFLVNPFTKIREVWQVFIAGTGHEIEDEMLRVAFFAGTVLMMGGSLVWHIWLRKLD